MSYKSLENTIHGVVSNSILDESIKHDRYVRAHGKKASGRGMWAFTTKATGDPKDREMVIVSGGKTLSDAAREAKKKLNTNSVYVMEHVELAEKSMSQAQQKAAGAALAAKRGEIEPSELVGASKEMYDSMSTKELEDFASTKHKGLPKKVAESVIMENEDEMPASPDEKRMAMKQAEFLMYVGREVGEHLAANKEFPEWMQNKLSALHQKAKDVHAALGAHGGDEMDEAYGREAAQKNYEKITKAKTGETVQQRRDWFKKNAEAARKRMQQTDEQIKKGDFVKDPQGVTHRVFDVRGNTLHTGKYHGNNKYGGTSMLHVSKATRINKPADVTEEADFKPHYMYKDGKRVTAKTPADHVKYKKMGYSHQEVKEVKSAPKGYHFTRSGQLKKGDADRDGPGGSMLRSDPLDKQRKKIPPLPEEKDDDGKEVIHTRRADFKLSKVRLPDGRMVYRKVKKEVDVEK